MPFGPLQTATTAFGAQSSQNFVSHCLLYTPLPPPNGFNIAAKTYLIFGKNAAKVGLSTGSPVPAVMLGTVPKV